MIADGNGSIALNGHVFNGAKNSVVAEDLVLLREPPCQEQICIRPCKTSDHGSIQRLCCETGFLGRPVDPMFHDHDLFAELFTRPYLDYEPGWSMVAEANGRIVGYLLGSVSRYFDWLQLWCGFQTASKMGFRFATGRYANHARSRKFVRWLFTAGMKEQPKHPDGAAHLHLDIDARYRGRGIGRKLWETYEQRLRGVGIERCYGAFFSHPGRRPESAYARFGFTVFDRRRTTMFEPDIPHPVEVVCVCKNL
ncbi:GNAT family N-acetyltransferase [Pedosphaera parvula]|uniref:GCN5-related N-acetyltransferase n=1 Tax=Pedosphaera parvula (strain Ellin514) TaxID=320771 RepID=B9XQU8_PEDPL|nr:GNAT family N-acetyltransferase [Pedosphaera parvula]EEF57805.1 GCN5-related N-acetyltransferase [Pedosphaera parvula Ellin514]